MRSSSSAPLKTWRRCRQEKRGLVCSVENLERRKQEKRGLASNLRGFQQIRACPRFSVPIDKYALDAPDTVFNRAGQVRIPAVCREFVPVPACLLASVRVPPQHTRCFRQTNSDCRVARGEGKSDRGTPCLCFLPVWFLKWRPLPAYGGRRSPTWCAWCAWC